jgi:hypothetical protein
LILLRERSFNFNWNAMDNGVDRISHEGQYKVERNKPL